jgi:hypothetical protein
VAQDTLDEAELRRLYEDEGMTQVEIAAQLGYSAHVIQSAVERFGIRSRPAAPRRGVGAGARNPGWKGGRHLLNGTYVWIHAPDHPCANKLGYVAEHVAVAYEKYGHPAPPNQVVHHINMVHQDNRPENLVYVPKRLHHMLHRQLEQLIPGLLDRSIVEFDLERGYHFAGEDAPPLMWDERRACEQCGEEFVVQTKRPRQRFCSRGCSQASRRGHPRTEWAVR